jgi:hypothetical protein
VKCQHACEQLTTYLDGELEDDRGSAVRGHLRECDACRQVAADEAKLRDGLRALPPIDPPQALWSGVQARLAKEEVADARRPAWRRTLAKSLLWLRQPQPLSLAGAAIATVVVLVVWKTRHEEPVAPPPAPVAEEHVVIAPSVAPPPPVVNDTGDVTADLAAQPARQSDDYAHAAAELTKLADDARASWSDDQKHTFDARVATLRTAIDHAAEGRPRQQAYRSLIRYLQGAVVRDEVALR